MHCVAENDELFSNHVETHKYKNIHIIDFTFLPSIEMIREVMFILRVI